MLRKSNTKTNRTIPASVLRNELSQVRRDLAITPYSTQCPDDPPTRVSNPVIERVVRLQGSAAGSVTPQGVALQDAGDYGTSIRYHTMTLVGVKVWGTDSTDLVVQHLPSGFIMKDTGSPGSRRSKVSMRIPPPLQVINSTADVSPVFVVTGGIIVDVVVRFV
jgi:hypothetical protein